MKYPVPGVWEPFDKQGDGGWRPGKGIDLLMKRVDFGWVGFMGASNS